MAANGGLAELAVDDAGDAGDETASSFSGSSEAVEVVMLKKVRGRSDPTFPSSSGRRETDVLATASPTSLRANSVHLLASCSCFRAAASIFLQDRSLLIAWKEEVLGM